MHIVERGKISVSVVLGKISFGFVSGISETEQCTKIMVISSRFQKCYVQYVICAGH